MMCLVVSLLMLAVVPLVIPDAAEGVWRKTQFGQGVASGSSQTLRRRTHCAQGLESPAENANRGLAKGAIRPGCNQRELP